MTFEFTECDRESRKQNSAWDGFKEDVNARDEKDAQRVRNMELLNFNYFQIFVCLINIISSQYFVLETIDI